ncbi:MAG: HepT-like ribonuclease domain-containing protein [Gemmatimonadota bacterium]|nr:HepT-like ribonuclease domain-containing protein [Gemmatimonadota bacterium]
MSEADFADVLTELDQLESELEAVRIVVDEGQDTYAQAPTAREAALRHLDLAMEHTVESAWTLVEEADWEEPEDSADAIEILAEEGVIPGRLAVTLIGLEEYASEHGEAAGWEADTEESFERLTEAADALAEYLEYVHHFLRELDEE